MINLKNKISINMQRLFKPGKKLLITFMIMLGCCVSASTMAQVSVGVNINIPFWAPTYDNVDQVQYYYLPDIEVFYDVQNQEFVYLEDGNWMFAHQLPPSYAGFDFNNAFVVVLNSRVHQPWMHYHYYVAHYPRYYYRTTYGNAYNDPQHPIRGFNENVKGVVYRSGAVNHVNEPRLEPISREKVQNTRPPQKMQYYGKTVGSPVKVEKQMMKPRDEKSERR